MAEQIKELIEKIQQEGIKAAEGKASQIENEAKRQADEMIKKAKIDAEKIIAQAKTEAAKIEQTTKISLKQAGRDLMLSLRKQINAMLDKIIVDSVREALNPGDLTEIITQLVKNYKSKEGENIIISVKKSNFKELEKDLLTKLGKEVKNQITLKAQDDILGGFIISYDAGKSHFDFTDEALAEYIGTYLKPKLKEILE